MPKLTNFIYCMNSKTSDTDANALGVLSTIFLNYIPSTFSFSILCSVLDVAEGEHSIALRLISPSGKNIVDIDYIIPNDKNRTSETSNEYSGINISFNCQNVLFEEVGIYNAVIIFDGVDIGTHDISVVVSNKKEGK